MIVPEHHSALPPENVFGHRKKLDFLRDWIGAHVRANPDRRIRVLDVGCSNGRYVTVHLGDLGVEITAIDPHQPSIEFARENNPHPESITFEVATVGDLPPQRSFDIIVLADVLEHLDYPAETLDAVKMRMVEDGIILASIPNGCGPFEVESSLDRRGCLAPSYWLFDLLSGIKGKLGRRKRDGENVSPLPYAHECGHVQFWTLQSFRRLVESHGLKIVARRNGPWLGALCTSTWFGRSNWFCGWNARAGDYLPSWCVSTWYFRIEIVK